MEKQKKAKVKTEEKKVYENYVVGIGASAGGLEALQKLLTALPSNTGFPYIIVQHLSPDYKSLLSEILAKYTAMPVIQVEDGMEIKPDCVYVIQPGKNMRLSNGKLLLSAQKEHELNLPIDMFFRSLAEDAGQRAISIVLSGTGSDGSNGIKSIKENDGMIIVQDPDSAKFDGMPRSAMRTGIVDALIKPEEIALELVHISSATNKEVLPAKTEKEIDEDLMRKIYLILKKVCNINFTHYKQTTILRRIERRMMLTHKEQLAEYVDFLYESPEEVRVLSKEVLIGVTNFFRDPDFFQALKDKAVKNILIHSTADDPIRVWVAGCSTGEEAYSIAIIFCEMMETLKIKRTVKIFATDLDVESIGTAGKGVYSENIIDAVSPTRLSRFFTRRNNTYLVNRDIRKMIVFSPHNVFQDPPFGRLDLISCRNMLIYFQPVLQNDLFAIFHAALKDNGYLFLGKSEAIGAYTDAFPVVDAAAKIFTHHSEAKIPGAKVIPFLQTAMMDETHSIDFDDTIPGGKKSTMSESRKAEQGNIDNELLEKFMPACLVVNEKNEIVHTYGENSNFVHFSIGKVSNGIYDIITEALKIPVSTLLKESRESKKAIQYKDIAFMGERTSGVINLTAMPINIKGLVGDNLYALIFSDTASRGQIENSVPYEIDRVASQRITDLEQDLAEVQGKLDKSVAEQECVNEELQAANEELLTANEELQSSNEELQSVNEELYTVNTEYQLKLTELADTNDDIANFLSSTLTGIIFVDNKLSIRRYTNYVASEFSVMDHDIGRSLKFISYHFPTVDITEICDNVLKTLVPDEREITTGKNKVFFMRVAPYRTTENKILGCVITLIDVTKQKQGLAQLQSAEKLLSMAQQASDAKSDLLSRIANEIQTPINGLKDLSETAKAESSDNSVLKATLDKMADTIKHMTDIVDDILKISNVDNTDATTSVEPFALRELLNTVVTNIRPEAKRGDIKFRVLLDDYFSPNYIGNKIAISQILNKFLSNAVKYTPAGGSVSLKAYEDSKVGNKATLYFVVSDTGVGISPDVIDNLFKPFKKNGDEKDRGLGLTIVYNLIKAMNGDVDVVSEVGKGTIFTIHIDIDRDRARMESEILERPRTSPDYDISGCHALIVDDNSMNRQILGSLLAQRGATYAEARDGEEAVNMFMDSVAGTYDCILMDIRMPNIDGIEATSMIRNSGKKDAKSVPIIGVSANGFEEDIQKAKKAGIDSYTTKPIDTNILFSTINDLLKSKAKGKK